MRALAVVSQKGGVGKTTLALNLGYALARRGWRTAVVDTDPQGAIGLSLTPKVAEAPGLVEWMTDHRSLPDVLLPTRVQGLHLLPVGQVAAAETGAFGRALGQSGALDRLAREAVQWLDLLVLDTPCGFGGITMEALRVASHAISPLQAEPIALRSVTQLIEVIGWLRERGSNVTLAGLVLSMLDTHHSSSLAVAEEVWSRFPPELILETAIPRDPIFLEASAAGVPVGLLRRRPPPVSTVFEQIAAEMESRVGMLELEEDDGPIALVD